MRVELTAVGSTRRAKASSSPPLAASRSPCSLVEALVILQTRLERRANTALSAPRTD